MGISEIGSSNYCAHTFSQSSITMAKMADELVAMLRAIRSLRALSSISNRLVAPRIYLARLYALPGEAIRTYLARIYAFTWRGHTHIPGEVILFYLARRSREDPAAYVIQPESEEDYCTCRTSRR